LSSEREALKRQFLLDTGLGQARRESLTGDASTRSYERLHLADAKTRILMDQPPVESAVCAPDATDPERQALGYNALARLAGGRVDAFVSVASWLQDQGLSAPVIFAQDSSRGLAVMEDLGDDLFARLIEAGAPEEPFYDAAIDALVQMQAAAPPALLTGPDGAVWPLLTYDDLALKTAGDLLPEWLPALRPEVRLDDSARQDWETIWNPIRAAGVQGASVFCHRDYHVENLIWLPARTGAARVGLVDFQDALVAHPVWDLSMLLHDARRDVSRACEARSLERYLAHRPQGDLPRFMADYHGLGALNISRIIGIFSRLVVRDRKPRYEGFLPRMWDYLDRCLADPALGDLKTWFDTHVPVGARR